MLLYVRLTELSLCCLLRAKLSYYCKASENRDLPAYMSAAVVAEMQNGWDLNRLKTGNEATLKGIRVFDSSISNLKSADPFLFNYKGQSTGMGCNIVSLHV